MDNKKVMYILYCFQKEGTDGSDNDDLIPESYAFFTKEKALAKLKELEENNTFSSAGTLSIAELNIEE
jgi:hypothetical protein